MWLHITTYGYSMKTLFTIFILGASLALASCAENPDETSETQKKAPSEPTFNVNITGLEDYDNECIANIKLENNTGEYVDHFQFIKYTGIYNDGEFSSFANYYRLEDGESTTRAGIAVSGTTCENLQEIRIDELRCNFKSDPKTKANRSCAQNVVLEGYKQVKLTLK